MPFEKIALLNVEPMKDVLDRLQIAMNGTHKFLEMLFLLIILFTGSFFLRSQEKNTHRLYVGSWTCAPTGNHAALVRVNISQSLK